MIFQKIVDVTLKKRKIRVKKKIQKKNLGLFRSLRHGLESRLGLRKAAMTDGEKKLEYIAGSERPLGDEKKAITRVRVAAGGVTFV